METSAATSAYYNFRCFCLYLCKQTALLSRDEEVIGVFNDKKFAVKQLRVAREVYAEMQRRCQ